MINSTNSIKNLQATLQAMSEDFVVILGPTASGKTKLAVELARAIDAEIISADSRQVYRRMDIGTGKDIQEYGEVPYHLIDILEPGEKYNISLFLEDFHQAYTDIKSRGKQVIVCGGTGFYIQSLLEDKPYAQVPVNIPLREELLSKDNDELKINLSNYPIPSDFKIDYSSKKRLIRAIEIVKWIEQNPNIALSNQRTYSAKVLGINPPLEQRRARISNRLISRLEEGFIQEVERLLSEGLNHEELEYYGLEYKYASYYLQNKIDYQTFLSKLETEIHRYAKRQMTYFRKMEKDGIKIEWL